MAVEVTVRKTNTFGKQLLKTGDKIMNGLRMKHFRKLFVMSDRMSREFWCSHTGVDGSG
jgi:hypothetical protein